MTPRSRTQKIDEIASTLLMSYPKNHHFSCFDKGSCSLARFQIHFASRSRSDNRRDLLFANRDDHFSHKATDLHTLNSSDQLIPATEAAHHHRSLRSSS